MRGERCGLADRRAWGGGPSGTCVGRTRLKVGASGTRGAHRKHGLHARDLGRVEAQRLIERTRPLPSYKGGICEARRGAGWQTGGHGAAAQAAYNRSEP